VGILSGDHPEVVRAVGAALGIPEEDCKGAQSPEDKLRAVEEAARDGVVMVGDGVNDAAALAAATVGVAMHGGAEASLASADVFMTEPGLSALLRLIDGAARTVAAIRRNLVFSLCYNVLGVALAMAGAIDPLVAAILMPLSSLTVVMSSYKARTFVQHTGC
jgi:Cu2+-exporting ATPase